MKKRSWMMTLGAGALLMSGCGDSHSEERAQLEARARAQAGAEGQGAPAAEPAAPDADAGGGAADWGRVADITSTISFYYTQRSVMKGQDFEFQDPASDTTWTLLLKEQQTDPIYVVAADRAHVFATFQASDGTEVVLDFEIRWNPTAETVDGTGKFEVAGVEVARVGDETRIQYEKSGEYWKRAS